MEQASSVLHQEYGERIHGLEQALNDVTERYFSLESRVEQNEKITKEPNNIISGALADELRSEAHRGIIIANDMEQYSRRFNVRIHGLHVDAGDGKCIEAVKTLMTDQLGFTSFRSDDIENAHTIPSKERNNGSWSKSSIIVKFRNRAIKDDVLRKRRLLKGSGVAISEDLTSLNLDLISRLQKSDRIKEAWAWNGRIYAKDSKLGQKKLFKLFDVIDNVLKTNGEAE